MAQNWSQNEGTNSGSLYKRGLQLYALSEKTEFQDENSLERGLRSIVQAAQAGEIQAVRWIGLSYNTKSLIPTKLPSELKDEIWRIAQQSKTEEQQRFSVHAGYQSMPNRCPALDEDVVFANPGPSSLPSSSSDSEERVATTARSIFSKMAGSSPTQTIPRSEIRERVQELFSNSEEFEESEYEWESFEGYKPSREELQKSMASIMFSTLGQNPSDEITEEAFCNTAVTLARGEVAAEEELLSPEESEDYDKASILAKVYKYPKQAFHFLKRYYFNAAQKHSTKWLWLTLHAPIQQFLFAYFLSILTVSLVVNIIAFIVFAVAFLVMMVATVEIFDNMEKISSSKKISFILQYFGKIEAKAPEQQVRSSIGHYATYIIAFPIAIGVLKMAQQQPVFMYIGMCLTVPAAMILVAIFVDFLHYRAFFLISGTVHVLYMFSLIKGPLSPISELLFVKQRVLSMISISCSLFTLVQLVTQLVLLIYTIQKKRSYLELVPCALFIGWLALCRNFLFHTDLDYFPIILCLFSTLLIALYSNPDFNYIITTLRSIPWWSTLVIVLFISIPVIDNLDPSMYTSSCSSLAITMPEYAKRCGPQTHKIEGNMVETQLKCRDLKGCPFSARGIVKSVKIDDSHKKSLPFIQATFFRLFGEADKVEIQLKMSLDDSDLPISVSLITDNRNVTKIKAGTELQFNSTFVHGMGSDKLKLKLSSWTVEGGGKAEEREDEAAEQHVPTHMLSSFENSLLLTFEVLFCCFVLMNL